MILSRRKLIGGIGLAFAAPAIVRAGSLMPIKPLTGIDKATYPYWTLVHEGYPVSHVFRFQAAMTNTGVATLTINGIERPIFRVVPTTYS